MQSRSRGLCDQIESVQKGWSPSCVLSVKLVPAFRGERFKNTVGLLGGESKQQTLEGAVEATPALMW